jgi:hypothetical protein
MAKGCNLLSYQVSVLARCVHKSYHHGEDIYLSYLSGNTFGSQAKPESICSELHYVILFSHNVFVCVRPCPQAFSSIVGLIRQDFFVIVHVVLLAEAPNRINVLDILSLCPGPYNGAPFVCKVAASIFELAVCCLAIQQVAFLESPITQCMAK